MDTAKLLLIQVAMMFVLSLVGYLLFKFNKVSKVGSKSIGNILIFVSLPCVIFKSFLLERTEERMIGLAISALAAVMVLGLGMVISKLFNKKDPIADFACCFSNPGFFGIPLIIASLVDGAVFYIATFIALLNILQWTYGVFLITKNKKDISLKKIITAPSMIAFVLGLLFFFLNIKLPTFILNTVSTLASVNTPLAMFTIGIYLAQTDILKMFKRLANYKVAAIKLVLIPIITIFLFMLIPNTYLDLKLAVLIACLCPTGSNIAVLAEMSNGDYPYAVETVVVSTLFSIITIPLLVLFANFIWTL